MKKQLIISIIVLTLVITGFSGCLVKNNDEKSKNLEQTNDLITIKTDKEEYHQGEVINFTINSSSGKICYLLFEGSECYRNGELFKIHFLNDTNWTNIPIGPNPSEIICPQWMPLGPRVKCISTPFRSAWDQQQRDIGQVKPGTYRICFINIIGKEDEIFNLSQYNNLSKIYYSNEFTIIGHSDLIMNFSYSKCGVFSFNESETGINETIWINNNSLNVKANVLINCGEEIINGSYRLVDNTIILCYYSPKCGPEECLYCMCGVILSYNFTNLEKMDYQFQLIRLSVYQIDEKINEIKNKLIGKWHGGVSNCSGCPIITLNFYSNNSVNINYTETSGTNRSYTSWSSYLILGITENDYYYLWFNPKEEWFCPQDECWSLKISSDGTFMEIYYTPYHLVLDKDTSNF